MFEGIAMLCVTLLKKRVHHHVNVVLHSFFCQLLPMVWCDAPFCVFGFFANCYCILTQKLA